MPDITITVSEELATRIQDYSAEFPHADRIIHDLATTIRLARMATPSPLYCTACGHRNPGHYPNCPADYDDNAAILHRDNDAIVAPGNGTGHHVHGPTCDAPCFVPTQ
jgi:hypothetical protein